MQAVAVVRSLGRKGCTWAVNSNGSKSTERDQKVRLNMKTKRLFFFQTVETERWCRRKLICEASVELGA